MALKDYQTVILPGVLYEVAKSGFGVEQIRPSLEVIGGTVAVYGSNNDSIPSPPTTMYATNAAFTGIDSFDMVPRFLFIAGTATKIILSGVSAKAV